MVLYYPPLHRQVQPWARPGIARVKFWSIVLIASRGNSAVTLRVSPARVTWQL